MYGVLRRYVTLREILIDVANAVGLLDSWDDDLTVLVSPSHAAGNLDAIHP